MTNRSGQQLGNYKLQRLLGQGGFAEVYLGEHTFLGTQTAIKILHQDHMRPDEQESFTQEARTVANLIHPHIVRLLDFGFQDGTPFLVMDYASGGSLRSEHAREPIRTQQPAQPSASPISDFRTQASRQVFQPSITPHPVSRYSQAPSFQQNTYLSAKRRRGVITFFSIALLMTTLGIIMGFLTQNLAVATALAAAVGCIFGIFGAIEASR